MSLQERATLLHVKEIENLKVIQIIELKKKKILPKKKPLASKKDQGLSILESHSTVSTYF